MIWFDLIGDLTESLSLSSGGGGLGQPRTQHQGQWLHRQLGLGAQWLPLSSCTRSRGLTRQPGLAGISLPTHAVPWRTGPPRQQWWYEPPPSQRDFIFFTLGFCEQGHFILTIGLNSGPGLKANPTKNPKYSHKCNCKFDYIVQMCIKL